MKTFQKQQKNWDRLSNWIWIIILFPISVSSQPNQWAAPAKKQKLNVATQYQLLKSWNKRLQQWGMDDNYNHALAIGVRLSGNGWSGITYYQRKINRSQSYFFQLTFSEIKHEKQVKQERANTAFPELGGGSPFVYGKINNLYSLQLGHGREFLLLPGLFEGNMSISLRVQAGVALAMLKPYYLKLAYVTYDTTGTVQTAVVQEEKYSNQNAEKFLNTGYIIGSSKWSKGLNEIQYAPGAFADATFVIEPLKNKTFIKTVTIGANFSFYSKELTIMAEQDAKPYTGTVFVGLSIGKRWR